MAPNSKVEIHKELYSNCANPYKDETSNERKIVKDNVSSGFVSLATEREHLVRNDSSGGSSPRVGTEARFTYQLDRYSKNAMLIIHNDSYALSDRTALKVKTTFEQFRFEVEVQNNKTGEEITAVIEEFFSRDFNQYGCAAVVVISPTLEDGSYATQGRSFQEEDILKYFIRGVVPTLGGKPKILISEANNMYRKRNLIVDLINKRDVYKLFMPNYKGIIFPPELNEEIFRNPMNVLCDRLDNFGDKKSFVDIVFDAYRETDKWIAISSSLIRRLQSIQCASHTLNKELRFWKTT